MHVQLIGRIAHKNDHKTSQAALEGALEMDSKVQRAWLFLMKVSLTLIFQLMSHFIIVKILSQYALISFLIQTL